MNKLSFSNNILDCITLELCIEKNTNIIISAIYRATRYTNEAISEFNNIILNNFNTFNNKKLIICGDFNLDILKTDNLNVNNFINTINEIGCFKTINKPTRVTIHSSTLIDNIFYNGLFNNIKTGIILIDISDHYPIFIIIKNIYNKSHQKNNISIRNKINTYTIGCLREELKQINFNILFEKAKTLNETWIIFIDTIKDKYKKCCPSYNCKKNKKSDNPWFNDDLKKYRKLKKKLYIKYIKNKNPANLSNYKTVKREFQLNIKKYKKEYYHNLLRKWNVINNIFKSTKDAILPDFIVKDNIKYINNTYIANNFNNYFSKVGETLDAEIPPTSQYSFNQF